PTPPTGRVHVFWDIADGFPKYKDETGTVNVYPSVLSFNGRTGIIVPAQADYDGFFLTPAEGNAAYDALGAAATAQSNAIAASQPLDATLTALAAQNWAFNAIPIGTGSD